MQRLNWLYGIYATPDIMGVILKLYPICHRVHIHILICIISFNVACMRGDKPNQIRNGKWHDVNSPAYLFVILGYFPFEHTPLSVSTVVVVNRTKTCCLHVLNGRCHFPVRHLAVHHFSGLLFSSVQFLLHLFTPVFPNLQFSPTLCSLAFSVPA